MADREETQRKKQIIGQIAIEWQRVARIGFNEGKEWLVRGFEGTAGVLYQKRLESVMEAMEKTAERLWEGTRL